MPTTFLLGMGGQEGHIVGAVPDRPGSIGGESCIPNLAGTWLLSLEAAFLGPPFLSVPQTGRRGI